MKNEAIRVLLVEDSVADAAAVREMLAAESDNEFDIRVEKRLESARSALAGRGFDVVLVDLNLPDSHGLETFLTIRKDYSTYPIIVLTGLEDEQIGQEALKQGAQDYLVKGQIDGRELDRSIRYAIERNRIAQENARLYRELEAASRAKDEFLAMVSHELRTPLTAILGWVTLLRDSRVPVEKIKAALVTIERNARLQGKIVDELLDISRIITGKLTLNAQPIMLLAVIESAVDSVRLAAEAKHITIECDLDPEVPLISGDTDRLQQVLWNLLSNSIKFTPEHGKIEIGLRAVDGHAEIVLTDTGIGIPADVLPHVFERFRQADSTPSRQHGGLGLGLSIVRHLVEAHGGTATAFSAGDGKGATFRILLPTMNRHKEADVLLEEPSTFMSLNGISVLVVEDELEHATLMKHILEQSGASVIAASNAEEGFRLFIAHRPDVLLTDIAMPAEDGFSLIHRVRKHEATVGAAKTPAAAITAYGRNDDKKYMLAGFDGYVAKPIETPLLVRLVRELAGRQESEELRRLG